jgi:hypothetical protein
MRFSVNPQYDMKDLPGASWFKVLFSIQPPRLSDQPFPSW